MDDYKSRVKQLYSFNGYFEAFFELLPEHKTGVLAFEALEREFYEIFGKNKYCDYATFRVMKRRYILRLQKKR